MVRTSLFQGLNTGPIPVGVMMNLHRIAANGIFVLHILVGLLLLVGWAFPQYRPWYLAILVAWPLSWILLGYCPLTKWELMLRQKMHANLDTSEEFIIHYAQKFFNLRIPSPAVYGGGLLVFFILLTLSL